jgi:Ca2+-binding EF-hand superfamily protein
MINYVIEDLWAKFDNDNSGFLDKQETRLFVQEALEGVVDNEEFNEDAFEEVFIKVDEDKSGTVDK